MREKGKVTWIATSFISFIPRNDGILEIFIIHDTVPFIISLHLKGVSETEFGVGVGFSCVEGIHRFLAHLSSCGTEDIYDSVSDGSLVPDYSSGVSDRESSVRHGIGTGFDGGQFKTLREIREIGDSG